LRLADHAIIVRADFPPRVWKGEASAPPFRDLPNYSPLSRPAVAAAGWRRRSLFSVCDLPQGLSLGKALARAYSPAVCRSISRLR